MDIPLWQHDCDRCEFLGRYLYGGEWFDLYYCAHQAIGGPTVVARWSDRGPDYSSGLCFGQAAAASEAEPMPPLGEALLRAYDRGLLVAAR
jgi:hypothetical protein